MNDIYERALAVARIVAFGYGYAIGLHGSGVRDLDLIAAPWTDGAIDGHDFVRAVACAYKFEFPNAYLHDADEALKDPSWPAPAQKPHGRVAYTIHLSPNLHVDISVMPRMEAS